MDDIFDENFLQEMCSFQNTNIIDNIDNIVPSQEITTPRGHRASCHRCGNIRKNVIKCSECPHVFCMKCGDKMMNEHGNNVFHNGCPLCKDLCCCGSRKSQDCRNIFHCYKKCMKGKCTSPAVSSHSYSPSSNNKKFNKFSIIPEYSKPIAYPQPNQMQYMYVPHLEQKQQVKFDDMCISFDDSENEIDRAPSNILESSNPKSFCNPVLESLLGPLAPAIIVSNDISANSLNESNDLFKIKSNLTPIKTDFSYYSNDSTTMIHEYKLPNSENLSSDSLLSYQQSRSPSENIISQSPSQYTATNNNMNIKESTQTYQQLFSDSSLFDHDCSKNKRMKLMSDDNNISRAIMNEPNNIIEHDSNHNYHENSSNNTKNIYHTTTSTSSSYKNNNNSTNTIPTIFNPHNLTEINSNNPFFVQPSIASSIQLPHIHNLMHKQNNLPSQPSSNNYHHNNNSTNDNISSPTTLTSTTSNQILSDNLRKELQKLHFLQNSPIKLGEYEYKLNDLLASNNSIFTSNTNITNNNYIPTISLQKSSNKSSYHLNTNKMKNNNEHYLSTSTPIMDRTNTVSSPNIDLLCKYYLQNNNKNNSIHHHNHLVPSSKVYVSQRSYSDEREKLSNCNSTTNQTSLSSIDNNQHNNILLKTPSTNNYPYNHHHHATKHSTNNYAAATTTNSSSSSQPYSYNWTGSTVETQYHLGVDALTPAGLPQCTPISIGILTATNTTTNPDNHMNNNTEFNTNHMNNNTEFNTNHTMKQHQSIHHRNSSHIDGFEDHEDEEEEDVVAIEHQQNSMHYHNILNDPFYETPDDLFFNTMFQPNDLEQLHHLSNLH